MRYSQRVYLSCLWFLFCLWQRHNTNINLLMACCEWMSPMRNTSNNYNNNNDLTSTQATSDKKKKEKKACTTSIIKADYSVFMCVVRLKRAFCMCILCGKSWWFSMGWFEQERWRRWRRDFSMINWLIIYHGLHGGFLIHKYCYCLASYYPRTTNHINWLLFRWFDFLVLLLLLFLFLF